MRKAAGVVFWIGAAALMGTAQARAQGPGAGTLSLHAGQVVPLRLMDTLSSTESKPGEVLRLEVANDVVSAGHVILRKGDAATAVVTRAETHHKRGQGGRVSLQLREVTLADGTQLALGKTIAKGGGGLGSKKYATLLVASLVLLSPAGTAVALLNHGEEIVLPTGTYIEGQVPDNTPLDAGRFPEALANATPAATAPDDKATEESLLLTTSVGDGSVRVKSAYMGEAPLTLKLKPGTYLVRVAHDGYREWKEKVVVDSHHSVPLQLRVTMSPK